MRRRSVRVPGSRGVVGGTRIVLLAVMLLAMLVGVRGAAAEDDRRPGAKAGANAGANPPGAAAPRDPLAVRDLPADTAEGRLLREAGEWLLAQMRDDEAPAKGGRVRGAWWRQIDDHPFTTDSLYSGVAGVVLPLMTLREMTGDERYGVAARRAVRHLIDAAVPDGAGLTWDIAWDDREEKVHHTRRHGLYDGVTGIAWTLLTYGDATGDAEAVTAGRQGLDWVVSQMAPVASVMKDRSDGTSPDPRGGKSNVVLAGQVVGGGALDVIAGNAGVVIALLDAYRITGDASYRAAARLGAAALVSLADRGPQGCSWPSRVGWDRVYPGFSHGVAGIAAALAQTWAVTGDAHFLDAAKEGARWLAATDLRVCDERGTAWRHDTKSKPDDRPQEGWCHGPAGTCRLHLLLYSLTGEPEFLAVAESGASFLLRTTDPSKDRMGAGFYAPSLCCGAAGVGTFLCEMTRATGKPEYAEHAAKITGFLDRIATRPAKSQACWSLSGRPEGKSGKLWHGTNLMTGQGGYVTFLGRLAQVRHRVVREVFVPPDFALPNAAPGARLLVAEVGKDAAAFHTSVRRLASYRGGAWTRLPDAPTSDAICDAARTARADAVAFAAAPTSLDINLHRRVIDGLSRIDDDVFPDATSGWLTGAGPDHVRAMLDRMGDVERDGIRRVAAEFGIASVNDVVAYPARDDEGVSVTGVYVPTTDRLPNVRDRVPQALARAAGAGFVSFSGNGDPMRVWLFPDARNADRTKHWPFDPGKVCRDWGAEGLEAIGAPEFAAWDVAGAVVQFTTCHAGVPSRALVESDIVSTFGTTGGVARFCDLAPRESLCLTILARAPAAYLAPIGANHGALGLVERCRLRWEDLSVGEAVRRGVVDVALHWRDEGRIPLVQFADGKPDPAPHVPGNVMREGTLNRIVYGDPTFRPFAGVSARRGALRVERRETAGAGDTGGEGGGTGGRRETGGTDGHARVAEYRVTVDRPESFERWNPYSGVADRGDRLVVALPLAAGDANVASVSMRFLPPAAPGISRASWTVETRRAAPPVVWVMLESPRKQAGAGPGDLWRREGGYAFDVTFGVGGAATGEVGIVR